MSYQVRQSGIDRDFFLYTQRDILTSCVYVNVVFTGQALQNRRTLLEDRINVFNNIKI